jgi:hypothetical protein
MTSQRTCMRSRRDGNAWQADVPSAQLTLSFEPAMPERWPTLRDFVAHRVQVQAKPAKTIAADMDLSPSILSRKLGPTEGDTHRLNCDDLERYIAVTGDTTPIEYLAAKFLQGDEQRRARTLARVESLATDLERALRTLKEGA